MSCTYEPPRAPVFVYKIKESLSTNYCILLSINRPEPGLLIFTRGLAVYELGGHVVGAQHLVATQELVDLVVEGVHL